MLLGTFIPFLHKSKYKIPEGNNWPFPLIRTSEQHIDQSFSRMKHQINK